jgi:phage-related protein
LTQLRESAIKLGVEFDDLPEVVQNNLKTSLSTAISRQGGQTAGAAMRKILESGDLKEVLGKFGEVAEKARESLSNFYEGLNNFQKSLIDILNQLIRLEEYRIDQSLRAVDIVKQSNDAMDRFRIGITTLDDANAHLSR